MENIDHIFRKCYIATNTWGNLSNDISWINLGVDFNTWFDINIKEDGSKFNGTIPWGILFATTIWFLWKCRNERHFDNVNSEPSSIATRSQKFAWKTFKAFESDITEVTSNRSLTKWCFPPTGIIKINSDGSTFGEYGWTAYEGLSRDSFGRWIEGFYGRIG